MKYTKLISVAYLTVLRLGRDREREGRREGEGRRQERGKHINYLCLEVLADYAIPYNNCKTIEANCAQGRG